VCAIVADDTEHISIAEDDGDSDVSGDEGRERVKHLSSASNSNKAAEKRRVAEEEEEEAEEEVDDVVAFCPTWSAGTLGLQSLSRPESAVPIRRVFKTAAWLETSAIPRSVVAAETMVDVRQQQLKEVTEVANRFRLRSRRSLSAATLESALVFPRHEVFLDARGRVVEPPDAGLYKGAWVDLKSWLSRSKNKRGGSKGRGARSRSASKGKSKSPKPKKKKPDVGGSNGSSSKAKPKKK